MKCHQFLLDLSGNTGIPSQYKIGLSEITKWFHIQAKHIQDLHITRHYHRGCYSISTGDSNSARLLSNFQLEINWQGTCHRVGLRSSMPDKPRLRVRFFGTCTGDMMHLPNSYFDEILEKEGFVLLQPTQKDFHRDTNIYNGVRSALAMRGSTHLDRNHDWTHEEGHVYKWRLQYDNQPYMCTRTCNVFHDDGKCPAWEKEKERRSYEGQQKCYVVSTSLLRHASDTKIVRVDAIPGAKVGHIANHVNNDATIFEKADVLAIHAGANMDLGCPEISKPYLEEQAAELVKVVKPMMEKEGRKAFIVDPISGPLLKDEPGGQHWAMVRSKMKKVAKEIKAEWVSLEGLEWKPEEDLGDDGVHYTASGTKKVMEVLARHVKASAGVDILEGMEYSDRPYGGIYRGHYKFGCYRCTRIHEKGACPSLPITVLPNTPTSPNNSTSNSLESFHSIDKTTHDISSGSDKSLIMATGSPLKESCGRQSRLPTTPSLGGVGAPISAAIVAATAAHNAAASGDLISHRLSSMAGNQIPTDPRTRSSSTSAKRERIPSDGSTDHRQANLKKQRENSSKKHGQNQTAISGKNSKK